jgi:hypothetical protein
MMIVDSVFSDISESLDASGAIVATLNTTGPLDEE